MDHSESKMEDEKDLEDSEVSDTPSYDESPLLTHQNNGYAKSNAVKEQIKHHNHGNNCNNHNNHNKKKKKMTKYILLKALFKNENHDITIAMSPYRADPVLGLDIHSYCGLAEGI